MTETCFSELTTLAVGVAKALSAVKKMAAKRVGSVAVMEGNRLVGIFTERDVMNRVVAEEKDPATLPISDVMTSDLIITGPDKTIMSATKNMKQSNIRHLPVVDGTDVLGIISLRDLMMVDADEKDTVIRRMNEYLYHNPGSE